MRLGHSKHQILKSEEVSEWLRIPRSTLYKLCHEGKIPGIKIGRHWRFDRKTMEDWFRERFEQGNIS
jgi:excisionase family DNA binding protein